MSFGDHAADATPRRPQGKASLRQPSPRPKTWQAAGNGDAPAARGRVRPAGPAGGSARLRKRGSRSGHPTPAQLHSPVLTNGAANGGGSTEHLRRGRLHRKSRAASTKARPPPRSRSSAAGDDDGDDPVSPGDEPSGSASPTKDEAGKAVPGDGRRMGDVALSERIEALQEQCEYYTKRMEVERRRADDLDKKLKLSRQKLTRMRQEIGRLDGRNNHVANSRKLSSLEHRLDKMSVRLNQALNNNKKLKLGIEDLRREKMQRESIKKKLEREVGNSKREMLAAIQESQQATSARDKAERLAAELEQTIASEMAEFDAAFQKRMATLELERQQHEHRRHLPPAPGATPAPGELDQHGLPYKGEMTIAQEQELKHRSTKAVWEVVKREVDLKEQEAKLRTFDTAFQRIRGKTGIETIDEMVTEFCDAEDHNFSLINIINGLTKETEHLEVQIADMEQKLREAKGKGRETRKHRNKIFTALESQIRAAEKKARWYNHKHDEAVKAIKAIKPGLLSTFQKVGCNDDATLENVAATGITDGNIMQVLGIIEQRIAEIVQMNELALGRLGKRQTKSKPSSIAEHAEATFLPSTLESSDDDDDDDALPLSMAALKARTAHVLSSKLAKGTVQLPNATPARRRRGGSSRGGDSGRGE